MTPTNKKTAFADTLKSEDTEEFIDIYFYRPIGYAWALLAKKLHITPNMITIASIFIGVAAGLLFYSHRLEINIAGMLLLMLANSFDSADGQLARMTNNKTQLGRILDGLAGNIWFIVIYVTLTLRCLNEGWSWAIWLLSVSAGVCHIFHAAMADYYRNVHLFFLKGAKGSEFESSEKITEQIKQLSWSKNFIKKIMLTFYRNYTKEQEFPTPNFQQLRKKLRELYPNNSIPKEFADCFRVMSKPLMKYTNILQFNTRVIALFVCIFINKVYLYFIFDLVVLNGIMFYMIWKHEQMCKKLLANLNSPTT